MYHYIRAHDPDDNASTQDLSVDPRDFRSEMSYVRNQVKGGKIVLMNGEDLIASLQSGCFPAQRIWIFTSDDGWSDTYDQLVPIAREYQIPFFLGIITDRIDTPGFVTTSQVQEIARDPLYTISSHSISHREQDKMTKAVEEKEMCKSKMSLEKIIQKPVLSYIYPVGKMSKNSTTIAQKCRYQIAWSTGFGTKWNPTHPSRYDVNRIRIHHTSGLSLFQHILSEESDVDKKTK